MLIGITGHKRNGKDTIADIFVKHFEFEKHALADLMKEACCVIFGWTRDYIEEHKEDEDPRWGLSPRQALILLGTEYGQYTLGEIPSFRKKTGRLLWVKSLLGKYVQFEDNWVISDVRFPHEEQHIHSLGGTIIRVVRPSIVPNLEHESEAAVCDVKSDFTIMNDGSLKDLENAVLDVALDIFSPDTKKGD
jgi:hypothetical protein